VRAEPAMARITWIASYPKSGNTWVRAIVDRIVHPGRTFDINALGETAPSFGRLTQEYVSAHKLELSASSPGEVRRYWTPVQRQICESAEHEIFLKTHNVAARFDSGPFPDPSSTASAIYIVRDPRDVALSYAYHYNYSLGLAVIALCTSTTFNVKQQDLGKTELLMSWGEHVYGWTSLKSCPLLVLRYEDLLADPAAGVLAIGEFLSKPLSRPQIEAIVATTSFEQLKGQEKARGFNESVRSGGFFRAGKSEQWRQVKDKAVFEPIIDKSRRMMRRFGYL
jgi:aryl sulfotransferase